MREALAVLGHYLAALHRQRPCSRVALERWQERQVVRHVRKVRRTVPLFRELWADVPDEEWRRFPATGRALIARHFARANRAGIPMELAHAAALGTEAGTPGPDLGGLTAGLSSGTSGTRGVFLASAAERRAWAGTALAKVLPRPLWQTHRVALFLRAGSPLYSTISSRRIRFEYFDLSRPLEESVGRLNAFRPTLLLAPPAILRRLAESDVLDVQPEKVVSVADVLEGMERASIEARFGGPVHQIYQATEGFLAATCAHGTLHLNEDVLHVELVPVGGLPGCFTPLLTDFRRTTQPTVRYALDDVLRLRPGPCPCGSPHRALEAVEGRLSALFRSARMDGRADAIFAPSDFHEAMLSLDGAVLDYRILHRPGEVEVRFVGAAGAPLQEAVGHALREMFRASGALCPEIRVERAGILPLAASGKLGRVRAG
jgi:putative adenylate-forming enzyme